MADVWIEEMGQMEPGDLEPYASKSGFSDLERWQNKIMVMANPSGFLDGWLYKVAVVGFQSSNRKAIDDE